MIIPYDKWAECVHKPLCTSYCTHYHLAQAIVHSTAVHKLLYTLPPFRVNITPYSSSQLTVHYILSQFKVAHGLFVNFSVLNITKYNFGWD